MGHLYAITPFTQLDYPGELACIAWFSGCNLRCAYCHNPDIVLNHGDKDEGELIAFLQKRQGLLTGVVFSGGEATCCPLLPELARMARNMGYKVKLDTNGTRPEVIADLLVSRAIDAVALDYKCPRARAKEVVGTEKFQDEFRASLKLLIEHARNGFSLEIRTTFHPGLMTEDDLNLMIEDLDALGYPGTWYIQDVFAYGEGTLGKVEKPDRALDESRLKAPKNFTLGFRRAKQP